MVLAYAWDDHMYMVRRHVLWDTCSGYSQCVCVWCSSWRARDRVLILPSFRRACVLTPLSPRGCQGMRRTHPCQRRSMGSPQTLHGMCSLHHTGCASRYTGPHRTRREHTHSLGQHSNSHHRTRLCAGPFASPFQSVYNASEIVDAVADACKDQSCRQQLVGVQHSGCTLSHRRLRATSSVSTLHSAHSRCSDACRRPTYPPGLQPMSW